MSEQDISFRSRGCALSKTCFISRLGGAGDVLHASHLPKLIKEHYGVTHLTFETNYHGMHILTGNPYIDDLQFVDVNKMTHNRMSKNLEWAQYQYDMVFNFANTIELAYCTNENDWRYYTADSWRRDNLGKNYYDVMTDAAGLPESYYGTRGQLYYTLEEHRLAQEWADEKHRSYDKVILVNLSGSTLHKKFIQAESVCRKILERYEKALIILTGDEYCKDQVFKHERVISYVGSQKNGFRSVALKSKYVDLNISLESGLILVAHSWDAPSLQLLTAASYENHIKYAKNAYWLQASVACSPCHRNPREYFGCPVRDQHPACIWFDEDKIMQKVEEAFVDR
jgi:ADP-heptose:LPS heptosyltransferase